MAANRQYVINIPHGPPFKCPDLSATSINNIIDQLNEGDKILKIVALDGKEYPFDNKQIRFLGNPKYGKYKLILLEENPADFFELCLCGSFINSIYEKVKDPNMQLSACLGGYQQFFIITNAEQNSCRYIISIVCRTLIVALDYKNIYDAFLHVTSPQDVCSRGTSISGKVNAMTNMIPFSILADIALKTSVTGVIFTGLGLSGVCAHAASLKFIDIKTKLNKPDLEIKSISFFGPLCGSPALHNYVSDIGHTQNHITVNCDGNVLDRLVADYQRLSPLNDTDTSSWDGIYKTLNLELGRCLKMESNFTVPMESVLLDDATCATISSAEERISVHSKLIEHRESDLKPIGTYCLKFSQDAEHPEILDQTTDMLSRLRSLRVSGSPKWSNYYSLKSITQDYLKENFGAQKPEAIVLDLTPKLTDVKIIIRTSNVDITFEGINLECVLWRELDKEESLTENNGKKLPFLFKDAKCDLSSGKSKLLSITPCNNKVVIRLYSVKIPHSGFISILTDFGKSNEVKFGSDNVVIGEEFTPHRVLHPTMNTEFLSAAMLRVALCWKNEPRAGGGGEVPPDPYMNQLWCKLLEIEGITIKREKQVLQKVMSEYLAGKRTISFLRNECLSEFQEMSRVTTETFQYKENVAVYMIRKSVGYLGVGIGSLIGVVGAILMIPALIMVSPLMATVDRIDENNNLAKAASVGYSAICGVAAFPAMVACGISYFLTSGAFQLERDYPSFAYQDVLNKLIYVLKGNPKSVVDELEPLEDEVFNLFNKLCPEVMLNTCSVNDVALSLNALIQNDREYSELKIALKDIPLIPLKLCLVGRVRDIRKILQNQYMIGFVGVHNAGKSTTIEKLLGVSTGADLLIRTEDPKPYMMGRWMGNTCQINDEFRDWVAQGNDKMNLQLRAVDFPGTDDERTEVGDVTKNTAELANFFVIIFKMGHIANPEKEVVSFVKTKHKPMIVLINHCDVLVHELVKPGAEARFRKEYAKVLEIPGNLIYFVSSNPILNTTSTAALFADSIPALRGCLFGMVNQLVGDPKMTAALAMRFIPPGEIAKMENHKNTHFIQSMYMPENLGRAAAMLMFNYKPLTAESLCELMSKILIKEEDMMMRQSEVGIDIFGNDCVLKCIDQIRAVAVFLNISDVAYAIFTQVYFIQYIYFYDICLSGNNDDHVSDNIVDKCVGEMVMQKLCVIIEKYYQSKYSRNRDGGFTTNCVTVLLGFHALVHDWIDKKNRPRNVVEQALVSLLERNASFELRESDIMQCIASISRNQEESTVDDLSSNEYKSGVEFNNRPVSCEYSYQIVAHALSISTPNEVSVDRQTAFELSRYHTCMTRWTEQKRWVSFQPFDNLMRPANYVLEVRDYNSVKKKFEEDRKTKMTLRESKKNSITVSNTSIVKDLFRGLLSFSDEEIHEGTLKVDSQPQLSLSDVFIIAAKEINDDPSIVNLVRDNASGFLYFDPALCTDLTKVEETSLSYKAFGRLVGLSIMMGVNLPIRFPITVYRLLLGYRIGASDLELIRPTLHKSLWALDDCALDEYLILFSQNEDGTYSGPSSSGTTRVTESNRMSFVSHVVKYFLCCGAGPVWQFCLGVQNSCPRAVFHNLTPVALQHIVEGVPLRIEEWPAKALSPIQTEDEVSIIADFWAVVNDLDALISMRLLAFITGSSSMLIVDNEPLFTVAVNSSLHESDFPIAVPASNLLLLPLYANKQVMKEKIIGAVCNVHEDSSHPF